MRGRAATDWTVPIHHDPILVNSCGRCCAPRHCGLARLAQGEVEGRWALALGGGGCQLTLPSRICPTTALRPWRGHPPKEGRRG